MPTFHRNFTYASGSDMAGLHSSEHLARVGPRLRVQVAVPESLAAALNERGEDVSGPEEGFALFDTGASATCADESVLLRLGLSPVDTLRIATPSGTSVASVYVCALYFPGSQMPDLNEVFVIGAQLQNQNYAVLIGRDILKDMILIYDGPGARITFAY